MPRLVPVDGDPFGGHAPAPAPAAAPPPPTPRRAARLVPVDGDPFSAPAVSSSAAGAAARGAAKGVLPAVAGTAGFGAGFAAAGTLSSPLELAPPFGTVANGLIALGGGLAGAFGAGAATNYVQDKVLDAVPEGVKAHVGMDKAQLAADAEQHPIAQFAGSLAPMILSMRPGLPSAAAVPDGATLLTRALANPAASHVIGGALGGGQEAASEAIQGKGFSPTKMAIATAVGAALNKPTALGNKLFVAGGNTAIRGMQGGVGVADRAYSSGIDLAAAARDWKDLRSGKLVEGVSTPSVPKKIAGPEPEPVAPIAPKTAKTVRPPKLVPVEGDPFAAPPEGAIAPAPQVSAPLPVVLPPPTGASGSSGDGQGQAAPAEPDRSAALRPEPGPLAEGERMVRTPAGANIRTRMGVVDASALTQAQGDNQNRDRTRDTTALQVQDIVSKFDPEMLHEDPSSDRGAPIIGPDGAVDSGNGRVLALNAIHAGYPEQAAKYRAMIEGRGFSTEGIANPILVQHRMTDMTPEQRRQFVIDSNKDTKLELSPTERARSDADSITPEMLATYAGGDLNSTANAGFVQAFNKQLTTGEMGNMIGSDRRLTPVGQQRIENAVVAHAYGEPKLLERMMESSKDEIRSITGSLADLAGPWARLREAAKIGEVDKSYDITKQLTDAAARVADARERGIKPLDLLSQMDMHDQMHPVTEELIRAFHNTALTRSASRKAVSSFLQDYIDAASSQQATAGLFGDEPKKTPLAITKELLAERDNPNGAGLALEPKETANDADGTPQRHEGRDAQGSQKEEAGGRGKGRTEAATGSDGGGREGRGGLHPAEGSSVRDEGVAEQDRSGITDSAKGRYQDRFLDASFTNRRSVHDAAIAATGIPKAKFETLPPARQAKLLKDVLEARYGIKVNLATDLQLRLGIDQILDGFQQLGSMAKVLGISDKAVGFGGKLSLVLQRKGGFLGQFSMGAGFSNATITLTGRSNSFGHEWGHALDFHMAAAVQAKLGSGGLSGLIRAGGLDTIPNNVVEAFVGVVKAMYHDQAEQAAQVSVLEKRIETSKSPAVKAALQKQIDNIAKGSGRSPTARTGFHQGALDMPGNEYWTKPTEMFARAWEAWLSLQMEAAGHGTEFLGKGDANYLSNAEQRFAKTFPKGEDRAAIFTAIDDLVAAVRDEGYLKGRDIAHDATIQEHIAGLEHGDRINEHVEKSIPLARAATEALTGQQDHHALKAWVHNLRLDMDKAAAHRSEKPLMNMLNRINNVRAYVFDAQSDAVRMIANRWKSPAMHELADQFGFDFGGKRAVARTWDRSITMRSNKHFLALESALHGSRFVTGIGPATMLRKLTPEQEIALRDAIESGKGDDADINRIAAAIRAEQDKAWYELHNALKDPKTGTVKLGYIEDRGYLHDRNSVPLILKDKPGFTEAVRANYGEAFDKEFGDPDAIANSEARLTKLVDKAGEYRIASVKALRAAIKTGDPIDPDLIEQVHAELRTVWSDIKTDAYVSAVVSGRDFASGQSPGQSGSITAQRVFSGPSRELLRPYQISNPIEAFVGYIESASRRTEWATRFGPDDAKLKDMQDRMTAEGVPAYDQDFVLGLFDKMTGRFKREGLLGNPTFLNFMSFLKMRGTVTMLGRAAVISMPEAAMEGVITANPLTGISALARSYGTMLQTNKGKEAMQWARTHGVIGAHLMSHFVFPDRWGHTTGAPLTRWDRISMNAINKTGLGYITEAQIARAARSGGHLQLLDLAEDFASGGKVKMSAIRGLNELGISDHEPFVKEMLAMGTTEPDDKWLDSAAGYEYITAVDRFARLVIAEPSHSDRPAAAANPLASYSTHSITAFLLQSYRNLTKRSFAKLAGKIADGDNSGAAKFMLGLAGANAIAFLSMLVWSSAREEVMNHKRANQWRNDGTYLSNNSQLAAQRVFALGWGEQGLNMYTGLQYRRPWYFTPMGAYMGNDLTQVQAGIVDPLVASNKHTNTTAYNASKARYNMFMAPVMGYVAGAAPGGFILTPMAAAAVSMGTSRTAADEYAAAVNGDKGSKTDPGTGKIIGPPAVKRPHK